MVSFAQILFYFVDYWILQFKQHIRMPLRRLLTTQTLNSLPYPQKNHIFKQFVQGWCCGINCLRAFTSIHQLKPLGSGYCDVWEGRMELNYNPNTYIQIPNQTTLHHCIQCGKSQKLHNNNSNQVLLKYLNQQQESIGNECCVIQLEMSQVPSDQLAAQKFMEWVVRNLHDTLKLSIAQFERYYDFIPDKTCLS